MLYKSVPLKQYGQYLNDEKNGTWKLYIKAGRQAWEAFVPVYNAVILMKIISRPWWWTILLFLPIVNLIMLPVVWVETARSFGKNASLDTFLAIISFGFYNYYLNYVADVEYVYVNAPLAAVPNANPCAVAKADVKVVPTDIVLSVAITAPIDFKPLIRVCSAFR